MDKSIHKVIHGTALEIFGYGIVITGDSGNGKSELSLQLIDRGHKLIADDHILISKENDKVCIISSDNHFMHIGEIGFIDVKASFHKNNVTNYPVECNLFIELNKDPLNTNDRFNETIHSIDILGHLIPKAKLHITINRPLDILVELLVKKQQQLNSGYNANQTFLDSFTTI